MKKVYLKMKMKIKFFFGKGEKDSPISITNNSNINSIHAASIPEDLANYQNVSDKVINPKKRKTYH